MRPSLGARPQASCLPLALLPLLVALLALLAAPAAALQQAHAGIVDWHKPLLGAPLLEPTPPQWVGTADGGVFVGITKRNLVAAWDERGDFDVVVLSGPGASLARLFSLSTGHLRWEHTLAPGTPNEAARDALLVNPGWVGTDVDFVDGGVVVLSEGRRVTKIGSDGGAHWSWEFPGGGSTNLFTSLMVHDEHVYVLSLTSSYAAGTLSHLVLPLSAPVPSDLSHIQSTVEAPTHAHLARSSGRVRAVWTEYGRIRTAPLEPGRAGAITDFLPGAGRRYERVLDVGFRKQGLFLARSQSGAVDVVRVDDAVTVLDQFEGSANADAAAPVYAAHEADDALVFSRVSWSHGLKQLMTQTITVRDGRAFQAGYSVPFDAASHGAAIHAAPVPDRPHPRYLLTTSTSALQLVSAEGEAWTREESLADLKAVVFVDLGEPEQEEVREVLDDESYLDRVVRHLIELKDLPTYIFRFFARLLSSSTAAIKTPPLALGRLHRDQFGLQKLVVAVSAGGKLYALDSANGNVVWTRNLGFFTPDGAQLDVVDMVLARPWSAQHGNPSLTVLAYKRVDDAWITAGYYVDAFTGQVEGDADAEYGVPVGRKVMPGRSVVTTFATPFENCGTKKRVLGVLDTDDVVRLVPACKKVAADMAAADFFFHAAEKTLTGRRIKGYTTTAADGVRVHATELWSASFEGDVDVAPLAPSKTASYARALGDKSTLAKYLNPHALVVTALVPGAQARIVVLDSVSGRVVFDKEVVGAKVIKAHMVENWLVWAWLDASGVAGWRIGSVELFEAGKQTPGVSSFADVNVAAIEKVFVLPTGVKSLGFTTSKFGVTAKEVVYVNSRGQLASIPRRLLDPRRPTGKPTSADKEEMLIPYDPFIQPDPKRVVTHRYPVLGLRHITSSPALLESTSLVLAHGTDMFLTRGLNPSGTFDILGDHFNKGQLVLTLAALGVGIGVARPAVRRKMLRAKWF
ncbi:hypothetical protein Q5752_004188 [Cryptotrichosporon argae]